MGIDSPCAWQCRRIEFLDGALGFVLGKGLAIMQ